MWLIGRLETALHGNKLPGEQFPTENQGDWAGDSCVLPARFLDMFEPLRLAQIDLTRIPHSYTLRVRNLGAAVLIAAIQDYRSRDRVTHESAAQFLYPHTEADREHLEWAVRMTEDVNPAWFREELDKCRLKWDAQRRVM